jgi:hypothetical protein
VTLAVKRAVSLSFELNRPVRADRRESEQVASSTNYKEALAAEGIIDPISPKIGRWPGIHDPFRAVAGESAGEGTPCAGGSRQDEKFPAV